MSLINQMLRDLDKRHALDPAHGNLPGQVRPTLTASRDAEQASPLRKALVPGLLVVALLAGLIAWWLGRSPASESMSSPPVATAPVPSSAAKPDSAQTAAGQAHETAAKAAAIETGPVVASPARLAAPSRPERQPEPAAPDERVVAQLSPAPSGEPHLRVSDTMTRSASVAPQRPAEIRPSVEKRPVEPTPEERRDRRFAEAMAQLNKGMVRDAAEALAQLVQDHPEHAPSWQVLVRILLEQGRPQEAIKVLATVVNARPGEVAPATQLARLQAEYENDAKALQTLDALGPAGQAQADVQGFRATLLQRLRRPAEAADAYRKALILRPEEGRWWIGLGNALEASGKPDGAREAWRNALQTPGLSPALQAYAEGKLKP